MISRFADSMNGNSGLSSFGGFFRSKNVFVGFNIFNSDINTQLLPTVISTAFPGRNPVTGVYSKVVPSKMCTIPSALTAAISPLGKTYIATA